MNKSSPFVTIILLCTLLPLVNCGDAIEDPDAPGVPLWVTQSEPTDSRPRGIRPYNEDNGIVLEWHPNPEEDLSGYKLYRAACTEWDIPKGKFSLIADINAFSLNGADTSFTDDSVKFNTDYYYYLRAYDQAGNQSEPSDTIRFSLISKVDPLKPTGTLTEPPLNFEWYDFTSSASDYILFLETSAPRNDIWISRFRRPNYGDFFQSIQFNFDGNAEALIAGQSYRWCIKAIVFTDYAGNIIRGSISNWAYFTLE